MDLRELRKKLRDIAGSQTDEKGYSLFVFDWASAKARDKKEFPERLYEYLSASAKSRFQVESVINERCVPFAILGPAEEEGIPLGNGVLFADLSQPGKKGAPVLEYNVDLVGRGWNGKLARTGGTFEELYDFLTRQEREKPGPAPRRRGKAPAVSSARVEPTWRRWGVKGPIPPGKVKVCRYRGGSHGFHLDGAWHIVDSFRTDRLTESGRQEIVSYPQAKALGGDTPGLERIVLGPEGKLLAVTSGGAVWEFTGSTWKQILEEGAFVHHLDLALLDEARGRVVAWATTDFSKGKRERCNDTWILEKGRWAKAKPSPKPAGLDDAWAGVFDTALGALVRFGSKEVGLFGGEVWNRCEVARYRKLLDEHSMVAVHDRASQETLLIAPGLAMTANSWRPASDVPGKIIRFDLGGCTELGTFHAVPLQFDDLERALSYSPAERALFAMFDDQSYRLDLAEAFELAKSLGPRTPAKK